VTVDPEWLDNYLDVKSYQEWEAEQYDEELPKFGDYITGLGFDDLTL